MKREPQPLPVGATFSLDNAPFPPTEVEARSAPDSEGDQRWRHRQAPRDWHTTKGPWRHLLALVPTRE